MKKKISVTLSILFAGIVFGQTSNPTANGFANFNEFKQNTPSLTFSFQLKKRTKGNIFMMGGIANYRLENVQPESDIVKLENEVWGITFHDTAYINSYPYSKRPGYNQIIEKGYYTYFIGEPAGALKEQKELGFIKPDAKKGVPVCCQVGYVIHPDGTIKLLRPEVLSDLCKDNEEISKEITAAKLKLEDVYKMFDFLKKYNATKK